LDCHVDPTRDPECAAAENSIATAMQATSEHHNAGHH